jgi:ABC-type nickel/cobalt efflux system permease component RcnA
MVNLISGIIASSLHVVTGPDHLAAVTPLAIENKKRSWGVGLFWGLGHIIGMLLIGMLFLAFKEFIPIEEISHYSEQIVGLILVGIGVWAIYKVFNRSIPKHKHPHFHDDPEPHVHIHAHPHEHEHDHGPEHTHAHKKVIRQNNIAAIGVGTIHGFAGVSHLILLLPTLALPSRWDSAMYLGGFGIGTLGAMILYAFAIGYIGQRSSMMSNPKVFRIVRIIGGLLAIVIGVLWFFSTFEHVHTHPHIHDHGHPHAH